ncbi:lipid-A-disaccharide synthase-related protein [bacterium]|nr:lipid-A-disaccharide synthase-related protein [bacterium]
MSKILFISNGAGEDAIAAQIIRNLQDVDLEVMPLVGQGEAYRDLAPLCGPRQVMPSGGLIKENLNNFWQDLQNGLLGLILKQIFWLRSNRNEYTKIVAVGDLWPVVLSIISGIRPIIFIGTAKSNYHHAYSYLESLILRFGKVRSLVRDELTAQDLRQKGVKALWVGNAMMDGLIPQNINFTLKTGEIGLALFPGSRQATYEVMPRLLQLSEKFAQKLERPICALVAVAHSIEIEKLVGSDNLKPLNYPDWFQLNNTKDNLRIFFIKGHIADVFKYSQVALGLAGTAHEQAAGWGIPVIAYDADPQNLRWYRTRQKGLLGEALIVTPDNDEKIIEALANLINNPEDRLRRANIGKERLGPPGGAERMAQIIKSL